MAIPAIKRTASAPIGAMIGLFAAAWAAIIPILPKRAEAATCAPAGYTVVFFNGVLTTPDEAWFNTMALRQPGVIGDAYNGEAVKYQLMYNWSQSIFQDVVETFAQRGAELDTSGLLSARWEIFWDSITGSPDSRAVVTRYTPSLVGVLNSLGDGVKTKLVSSFAAWVTHGGTAADYRVHDAALELLVARRQKILMVAHSQGNLFLVHAYDAVLPKAAADSVKAMQVAPASPDKRGDYVLSDADLVINGLRLTSTGSSGVLANSLTGVPTSTLDLLGHNFFNIYLNASLFAAGDMKSVRQHVHDIAMAALAALKTPPCGSSTYTYTGNPFNYFNGIEHLEGNVTAVFTFNRDLSHFTGVPEAEDLKSYTIGFSGNQSVTFRYPDDGDCGYKAGIYLVDGQVTQWIFDILGGRAYCSGSTIPGDGTVHLYSELKPNGWHDDEMMYNSANLHQYFGAVLNSPGKWSASQ